MKDDDDLEAAERKSAAADDWKDDDADEDRMLDAIVSLPRVGEIVVSMRPTQVKPPKVVPTRKANIELKLKPFIKRDKAQMVTMGDMKTIGGVRAGAKQKREPS